MVLARAGLARYPLRNRGLLLPRSRPPAPQTPADPGTRGAGAETLGPPPRRLESPRHLLLGSSAF